MTYKKFSQSLEVKYENVSEQERTLALITHLLCLFFSFIPPLVIYLTQKDQSAYIREHAKEALNFQLSVLVYMTAGIMLMIVLIGFLVLFIVPIANIVLVIIATIKANDNILYRYPFSLRLIA